MVPTVSLIILSLAASDGKTAQYYSHGRLGIKEIKVIRGGQLRITFKPTPEQHHWCPGVKLQETKKGLELTFVRCPNRKSCSFDVQAKIGRHLVQTAVIDSRGKDVYIKSGKQLKKIHSVKRPAKQKRGQKQQTKTSKKMVDNPTLP